MTDALEFERYVRTPFQVQAIKITADNIDDLAKLVGEVRTRGEEKFISLDRRIVPNVSRAFVGWYVTMLGDNLRCYSPKVFADQFIKMPANSISAWAFPEDMEEAPLSVIFGGVELPTYEIEDGSVSIDPNQIEAPFTGFTTVTDIPTGDFRTRNNEGPVNPPPPGWPTDPEAEKSVTLAAGEAAQYDPKTD